RGGYARAWAGCEISILVARGRAVLASVAPHSALRCQGLGAALTSWLTRHTVRRHGFCTLWQLADNAPAERLYDRLGYRNEDPCVSARFAWH
ncbi:GNAT family N-acetyltransferase, partial [Streptomyces rimosus]